MSAIEAKVKEVIAEQLDVEISTIVAEALIIEDLGADSLDSVELVMALEEAFDLDIPDNAAEKITTVQDVIDLVSATEAA